MFQRRYTAPPNQAGLSLESVIGYNGNGRGNMIWHPDTGKRTDMEFLPVKTSKVIFVETS